PHRDLHLPRVLGPHHGERLPGGLVARPVEAVLLHRVRLGEHHAVGQGGHQVVDGGHEPSMPSTFGSPSNRVNVPSSANSRAAARKPPHAVRARVPPTLIRRTPNPSASATEMNGALISRLTAFGATADTIAAICSTVSILG